MGGGPGDGYEAVQSRETPLLEEADSPYGSEGDASPRQHPGRRSEDAFNDSVGSGLLWGLEGSSLSAMHRDSSLGAAPTSRGCGSGRCLVYMCALCSSLCSVLLGYDVGVMSGAKEFITPDLGLSPVEEEIVVGSLNVIAAFGGLVAGKAADTLGRRPTIALACLIFIMGALIMTISQGVGTLLVGRAITGVGVGSAMVIAPVYIVELAPPDIRGMLVSLTDICINLGILVGYGSSLMCDALIAGDSMKWRAMLGIGTLPPAVILACLFFMPESPRWLVTQGRQKEGLDVLLRVMESKREAREALHQISSSVLEHQTQSAPWKDVICPRDGAVRAAVVVGVGLGFWQQASGSEAAVYYTPEVLRDSGWSGRTELLLGNIGVGGFKLTGEVVAFFLLDRYGRRPLFLLSSALVTCCLFGLALSFSLQWSVLVTLAWLCMFMFTFSLGLGPVTFVVASEVFPLRVRSKAMSLTVFVNRLMSGLIALSYESIARLLTPAGSFYFFAAVSLASIWFYWAKVPETRGKALEDISADLDPQAGRRSPRG